MTDIQELTNSVLNQLRNINRETYEFAAKNPYKQFTFTVANGAILPVYYTFNYFRILSISTTTNVTLRFGNGGAPTDVVGAGIGFELPAIVDRVDIINNSGGSITITIAMAIGRIDDSRFTASGTVTANPSIAGYATLADNALSTTAEEVLAANSNRNEAFITNLDTAIDIYVGDSNVNNTNRRGSLIKPGATAVIQTQAAIYAVAASGTPSVGLAYTTYT